MNIEYSRDIAKSERSTRAHSRADYGGNNRANNGMASFRERMRDYMKGRRESLSHSSDHTNYWEEDIKEFMDWKKA